MNIRYNLPPHTVDVTDAGQLDMRTVEDTLRLLPALEPAWHAWLADEDNERKGELPIGFRNYLRNSDGSPLDPALRRAAFQIVLRQYASERGIDVRTFLERQSAGDTGPTRRGPNRTKPIDALEPAPIVTGDVDAGDGLGMSTMADLRAGVPERDRNMIPDAVIVDGPKAIANLRDDHERFLRERILPRYSIDAQVTASDGSLRLLTPLVVATLFGVTEQTLARWRRNGYGPRYIRTGPRNHAYPVFALVEWITVASDGSVEPDSDATDSDGAS